MKSYSKIAYGVIASVYEMDAGEKVPLHMHGYVHTTSVMRGKTQVFVDDGRELMIMTPEMRTIDLPANIKHEVTAVEDGTMIIHIHRLADMEARHAKQLMSAIDIDPDGVRPTRTGPEERAGVQLADGTVV